MNKIFKQFIAFVLVVEMVMTSAITNMFVYASPYPNKIKTESAEPLPDSVKTIASTTISQTGFIPEYEPVIINNEEQIQTAGMADINIRSVVSTSPRIACIDHKFEKIINNGGNHTKECITCGEIVNEAHVDTDFNGFCDVCDQDMWKKNSIRIYTAMDEIVMRPTIIEDGNSNTYKIEWYRSNDNGTTWNLMSEAVSANKNDLKYLFYADCESTFSQYKYKLINEAGTVESEIISIQVFEKYEIKDKTLTILSTGYIPGKKEINFKMNNYSDPRWHGKTMPWKTKLFENLLVKDHITNIGSASFKGIKNLKHVYLNEAVHATSIEPSAFEESGILGITIPEYILNVKSKTFTSCLDLRDIRFLGKQTLISEDIGTIQGTTNVNGIDGYDRKNDPYNRQHGFPVIYGYKGSEAEKYANKFNSGTDLEYNFMPIDDSNGNYIAWNFQKNDQTKTVKNFYTNTIAVGDIYIPKSIDGYLVDEIGNIDIGNKTYVNLFGKVVNIDNHNQSAATTGITTLRIPDSVCYIGIAAVTNCPDLKEIYNNYIGNQTFRIFKNNETILKTKYSFNELGANINETNATIYLYSANHDFESAVEKKYSRIFYDKKMEGITKDMAWKLDMRNHALEISTYSGSPYKDEPFAWTKEYVENLIILDKTKRIEDRAFAEFTQIKTIINDSIHLSFIGTDAFKNVGNKVSGAKTCTTYVDNLIYDAVSNIASDNPFKFIFNETTKNCAIQDLNTYPAHFTYNPLDSSLVISPYKEGIDSVMDPFSENDIPWRCVKDYIKKVSIEKNVINLSANSFTKLPNLKEVYNKAEKQDIIGTGVLFDVIERYQSNAGVGTGVIINVSDPIDYNQLQIQLQTLGFNVSIDELKRAGVIPGRHTIYTYMLPNEMLKTLSESEKYIVPVLCNVKENINFVNAVPQPESKGYRLESIFIDSGICGDNLKWCLYKDGVMEITGTGPMYDYPLNTAPWYKHNNNLHYINLLNGATYIGDYAFSGLSNIKTVDLPPSVTSLGLGVFENSGIIRFTIPASVTTLKGAIFVGCNKLTTLKGTDEHFKLIDGMLYSRDETTLVEYLRDTIYDPLTSAPYEELSTVVIPAKTVKILPKAFYKNTSINKLYLTNNVKEIGDQSLASMEKLYFLDCKTGESDPPYIGDKLNHVSTQKTNVNALDQSAKPYPSKEVLIYRSNTDLEAAAKAAGYRIRYYDMLNIDHINAHYTGDGVVIGETIPVKNIIYDIIYASGLSESTTGEDVRFQVNNSMVIKNIGDNVFTATYDDGYVKPVITGTFTVTGINRITEIGVRYNGLDVWYGENFDPANLTVSLKYSNGDVKIISGEHEFLTYSDKIINTLNANSHVGTEQISVTYNDKQNKIFTKTFEVPCNDYIESIQAKYNGADTIESTGGVNALTDKIKQETTIDLKWKSLSTTTTINGLDGSVSYSGGGSVVNNKVQFNVTYNKGNRFSKSSVINIGCVSNIKDASFTYVGGPVTKGTSINLANILVTIYYNDGSQKNMKADTLENIKINPSIIANYGSNTITITYNPPGFSKTQDIIVMGTIAIPIKLIIVERPKKTVYIAGETFDRNGLRVNCLYDNGELADVSDHIVVDNGTALTATTKNVVLSYTENRDGKNHIVKTYLSININQNQKDLFKEKTFKESYEIERVLFRSKKTEDTTNKDETTEPSDPNLVDNNGKWSEIVLNDNSKGQSTDLSASIKAGYGFELKVFTKYKTERGNAEFKAFVDKTNWNLDFDTKYASVPEYIAHKKEWTYLNDIYPQHVPTSNPDMMYARIIKRSADAGDKYTMIGSKNFIIMEKTNKDEKNHLVNEGEWYNSQKIFEFPLRTVDASGNIINTEDEKSGDRRLYVSKDAAESGFANTEYVIQILSPAWYGYESEPAFNNTSNMFLLNDENTQTGIRKNWYNGDAHKYLHVAYEFSLFVQKNDDIHTHILQ